ncbi:hypothetical protein HOY80DRAFT_1133191 [Tuber brumale]|nr:hypothetical protein HOY80DRAFT_1133191 [Tuber brumale]
MARYPRLVAESLLCLSTLASLSVSQSAWTLDPEKHLALMFNHMSAVVNSTIYTIGGTAIYWTPESTAFSTVSANNNSIYILKTANSFLRALDLSKPLDFEAEFSDTSEVISELPFTIPHVKRGAVWVDQNTIYYWGGELEGESVYMNGAFQNTTREWPDPMKYYTYDLSQPKWSGKWKTVSISEGKGLDTLTSSPSYGEYAYSTEARKGFYLGGVMAMYELKNKDGSIATTITPSSAPHMDSMVVFDPATNTWRNEAITEDQNGTQDGVLVYVAGVGEKGILVRLGGRNGAGDVGAPLIFCHIFIFTSELVRFDTVYVYDIGAEVWYRQPTTSKTNIFPAPGTGGFCAGVTAAPDKTSFTIFVYGGSDYRKPGGKTWALTMPYFQWLPVGSTGAPDHGRSDTTCQAIGGQLVMVRGRDDQMNRVDTNGGSYFYDMTNLTWSLKYKPSDFRVPKTIYGVIGGNGQGGANLTGPADDKNFAGGLGKLFAAAVKPTHHPNPNSASSSSAGPIVGGVIGSVALLAAIGASIWALLRLRRRIAARAGQGEIMNELQGNSLMGMGGNPAAPNHGMNSHWEHGIYGVPLSQPPPEPDNTGVSGGTHK